eukprot:TRINITY_DN12159_c0_g1_i1.p2 TRINITY_DN12159_c0_g1~~TRINITY_DN12159_c0_g1_i1.p2  ORF type:complete len:104 (+),score=12.52 TRINITY_DN12159_c0_g1_i1:279-590(+)
MSSIRARTLKDKIDLFIEIADEDGNGHLSRDEIFNLCKVCLSKFIESEHDTFLDELCEYFTKLIFESVKIDIDQEIPLNTIKQTILSGHPDSNLLCMFCGADI